MVGLGSSGGDLRTPQFDGANYDFWVVEMETILIAHDLWDVVEVGVQPQPVIEEEEDSGGEGSEAEQIPAEAPTISREDRIKNAKALSLIQGALTDELFPRIRNEKTAKRIALRSLSLSLSRALLSLSLLWFATATTAGHVLTGRALVQQPKSTGPVPKRPGRRPLPTPARSRRHPSRFRRKIEEKSSVSPETSPTSFSVVRPPFLAIQGSASFELVIPATSGQFLWYIKGSNVSLQCYTHYPTYPPYCDCVEAFKPVRAGENVARPKANRMMAGENVARPKANSMMVGENVARPKANRIMAGENVARPKANSMMVGENVARPKANSVMASENVARPKVEVARVVGVAGVLIDLIRGRVRPVV
ncbi:unnamed protein product [Prunus armeniaca]